MGGCGINLYNATIEELILVTPSLAGEEGRLELIAEVDKPLNEFGPGWRRTILLSMIALHFVIDFTAS